MTPDCSSFGSYCIDPARNTTFTAAAVSRSHWCYIIMAFDSWGGAHVTDSPTHTLDLFENVEFSAVRNCFKSQKLKRSEKDGNEKLSGYKLPPLHRLI